MIILNDYKDYKIKFRYYFLKFCPKIFYSFILKYFYFKKLGKKLNLNNPIYLSEKIQYLKLYDSTVLKTLFTDKLLAKGYAAVLIPELKSAKVYDIAESFDKLDFSKCPDKFVLKTNHACKTHILIFDKNNISKEDYKFYRKYYKKVLGINYAYWGLLELQYKNIKPLIYAEEYLVSNGEYTIKEYEVYCINSTPCFINYVVSKRDNTLEYQIYDSEWKKVYFKLFNRTLDCPEPDYINRDRIIEYSKILSKGFKFVRVDLFEINNELYFGELTFTPNEGLIKFVPNEYDCIYGQKLNI